MVGTDKADDQWLDELERVARAATIGPWAWFHDRWQTYLATVDRGRIVVMQFARRGMRDAQPMFQVRKPDELPGQGVMRTAVEIGDQQALRQHPDAAYIAAFSPDVALRLIELARHGRSDHE